LGGYFLKRNLRVQVSICVTHWRFLLREGIFHLLAGVVVSKGKDTDDTCPSSCNLPGELAGVVLSVGAKTEETTKSDDSDGVTKHDRVVAVGLGLFCGLLCLLLGLLCQLLGLLLDLLCLLASLLLYLLCFLSGLLLDLLGLLLSLLGLLLGLLLSLLSCLLGLLSLLASLGLKTLAVGLGLSLDFLRLEVGRDRWNVRAVDVDELVDVLLGVLNLGNSGCAPGCLLALACFWRVVD
jgi:hypothetical protein